MERLKCQWLLLAALLLLVNPLFAQKKLIDSSVYGKWPAVDIGSTNISNDGNYATFVIKTQAAESKTTVIRSVQGAWKTEFTGDIDCRFSQNSRSYIFRRNDSIGIGLLGRSGVTWSPIAGEFKLVDKGKQDNWLIYKNQQGLLTIRGVQTGLERKLDSVKNYWLNDAGEQLVLQVSSPDKESPDILKLVELNGAEVKTVWSGKLTGYPVFDDQGTQLAFAGAEEQSVTNALWYYKKGSDKAIRLTADNSRGIDERFDIGGASAVSQDGVWLFFSLKEKALAEKRPPAGSVKVDVYSYKDARLQSEQLKKPDLSRYYAVFNIPDKRIVLLEKKDTRLLSRIDENIGRSGYVLVRKYDDGTAGAGTDEWNWNPREKFSISLLSLEDGTLHAISKSLQGITIPILMCQLSPNGKYVVWYDPLKGNYFSYSVDDGSVRNITGAVQTNWTDDNDVPQSKYYPMGSTGYLPDDKGILLYDRNDIYQIDLSGKQTPLCLTNYFGRRHHTSFRMAMYDDRAVFTPDQKKLIVNSFDLQTKKDGFSRIEMGIQRDPERLTLQPFIFDGVHGGNDLYYNTQASPIKARDAKVYIVQRQSETDAPNLFYTNDFRSFHRLTNLEPQKAYNWLTSELLAWKTQDGTFSQGVLYKPENFDPKKKYPVIFLYYEKVSNELHAFPTPTANGAEIDIPTYVSNGYLVFTPDIHYRLGNPGKSAYNSVVSAAQHLARMPWVDGNHMAINGHSFGGYETEYIVAHTGIFKAACAASGWSDFISAYNDLRATGASHQFYYEMFRERMGATPWEKPAAYIESSPIFRADKVTTPLLMMNNVADDDVEFHLGVEFFLALRRLQKKVWMLQYDGQGHVLFDKDAMMDFSVRMRQFFDHYLKGAPPPVWMTRGVPARLKGIDGGLAIDKSGAIP